MNQARVKRNWLLGQIAANRDNHRETYLKALEGYKEKVRAELEEYLRRVEEGDVLQIKLMLPQPEEHLADYDRVISMLEHDVRDEIEIADYEYDQYVMDRWTWSKQFAANTVSYVG